MSIPRSTVIIVPMILKIGFTSTMAILGTYNLKSISMDYILYYIIFGVVKIVWFNEPVKIVYKIG